MNRQSTLPSTREQARCALLLLGAPAPARVVVQVHRALFDGDLDVPALAALLRAEQRTALPVVCRGLAPDLTAMYVALAEWPLERRIITDPHADLLAAFIRVADFIDVQPGASRTAEQLLRSLAEEAGVESVQAARTALEGLTPATPPGADAARRAAALDPAHQTFGVPVVPHQRGGA
jgi:hypothetical protein